MPQPPQPSARPAPAHQSTSSDRWRRIWRSRSWPAWGLLPVAGVYGALSALQRSLYRWGLKKSQHAGVPTLVIGNVIAGGAGKTPVTLATVAHLQALGLVPGIISRGYGRSSNACQRALPSSTPDEVGDEPLLMARSSGVPVYVARQRIDAARALLAAHPEVNALVCDDGLQHHALARDVNICVFNNEGIGNGWLLPAGPLREAWPRGDVDVVLHSAPQPPAGTPADMPCFALQRQLAPYAITREGLQVPLASLQGQPVQALAAIARPEDFFAMLRAQGLTLQHTQALPDHYDFHSCKSIQHLDIPLICTEKDAAKLWPHAPHALAVPLHISIDARYRSWLAQRLGL